MVDARLAPDCRSIGSWSCFPCPGSVVAEAFEEPSRLRDPRQLAAGNGKPIEQVLNTFDLIFNGAHWRSAIYITMQDVLQYAEETNVLEYYCEGSRLSHVKLRRITHDAAIVFASWCGHLHFLQRRGRAGKR